MSHAHKALAFPLGRRRNKVLRRLQRHNSAAVSRLDAVHFIDMKCDRTLLGDAIARRCIGRANDTVNRCLGYPTTNAIMSIVAETLFDES